MIELVEKIKCNNEKNNAEEGIGIGYTPYKVALYMAEELLEGIEYSKDLKILDPATGNGIFVAAVVRVLHEKYGVSYEDALMNNIYVIEKDLSSYNNLIAMMLEFFYIEEDKLNFYCEDSLEFLKKSDLKFDLIIGNPPYISLTGLKPFKEYSQFIENTYSTCVGYYDIYYAFIEAGLGVLKEKGKLQYILPNSFMYSYNTKNIRSYVRSSYNIEKIVDFGENRVFGDKFVCASIIQIENIPEQDLVAVKKVSLDNFKKLSELQFINYNKSDIKLEDPLFFRNKKEIDFIKNCENKFDLKLGDIMFPTIATLRDKVFVVNKDNYGYYYEDGAIKKYIEEDIVRPFIKIGRWEEKYIIFPYNEVNGNMVIIPEEELSNSYPKAYRYLVKNKKELSKRDGGKKNRVAWYAYGRSQGMKNFGKAILIPNSSKVNSFKYNNDSMALYGNGSIVKLPDEINYSYGLVLKILESEFFMEYMKLTTGIIKGGSYRLNKRHIGGFSLPNIKDPKEKLKLLKMEGEEFEAALLILYGIIEKGEINYGN